MPLALAFLRRQPEDIGLLPDGARPDDDGQKMGATLPRPPSEASFTRAEALRTPTFWLMVGGFGLATFSSSTMNIFRVPHFVERGLAPELVALAIATDAVVAAVVGIAVGPILDRFPPRFVAMVGFASMAGAALTSIVGYSVVELFIATICFGIGAAIINIAQGVMWANSFGRAHLGSIRGLALPMTIAFSGLAYPMTGYIRDIVGFYTPAWWIAVATLVVAASIVAFAKPPQAKAPATAVVA